MKSAVLFLIFNRPDTAIRSFERIRRAQPPRLYVAADGARPDRTREAEICEMTRTSVLNAVDWPCEVKTLLRAKNLGCRMAVSEAITWFFEHEKEGIIIEDDVAPLDTFFPFCDELLERYRDDQSVAMIGGNNFIASQSLSGNSYFFSLYGHIWGWATWRRAWKHYELEMSSWPRWRDEGGLGKLAQGDRRFERHWGDVFEASYDGKGSAWSYQWMFACWRRGALCIQPAFNQAQNIGFAREATNTIGRAPRYVRTAHVRPLKFPLTHPEAVVRSITTDRVIGRRVFEIGLVGALKREAKRVPGIAYAWSGIKRIARLP
jgi:hypothetical protein